MNFDIERIIFSLLASIIIYGFAENSNVHQTTTNPDNEIEHFTEHNQLNVLNTSLQY